MMVLVVLAILLAGLVLYWGTSYAIAYVIAMPSAVPVEKTPAVLGLAYEDISFRSRTDGILLKGWYLPGGNRGTIIVIHGGKQNRADATMQLLDLCGDLARKGFNVLTFDRRGCGASEVPGCKLRRYFEYDAGGAVDYIRSRNGADEKIFLLGISIGAAAALVFAADEEGISGVVSDGCFASTLEMTRRALAKASRILTIFGPGASLMGKLIYGFTPVSAIDYVASIKCPVLFIHGAEDDGVPAADAHALYLASGNQLDELCVVPGAGHSQAYAVNPAEYVDRITAFFTGKCGAPES
jgi:pimeloyl-ACP methyl ester carboxylesterase